MAALTHQVILYNYSSTDLYTADPPCWGADVSLGSNQIIPNGQGANLGTFQTQDGDQWDWSTYPTPGMASQCTSLFMRSPESGNRFKQPRHNSPPV
jgi:hypothetical protein